MTVSDGPERPSRVEREVLEILERSEAQRSPVDQLTASVRHRQAATRSRMREASRPRSGSKYLSPGLLRIAGALALAIIAAAIADASHLLAMIAGIASLLVFFSLWFPSRASLSSQPLRWRGRDIR
ncbi:MAG: hypothetical protein QM692_04770 [Thermomicrobiales bacterium]